MPFSSIQDKVIITDRLLTIRLAAMNPIHDDAGSMIKEKAFQRSGRLYLPLSGLRF
jgi:hypothetical protein